MMMMMLIMTSFAEPPPLLLSLMQKRKQKLCLLKFELFTMSEKKFFFFRVNFIFWCCLRAKYSTTFSKSFGEKLNCGFFPLVSYEKKPQLSPHHFIVTRYLQILFYSCKKKPLLIWNNLYQMTCLKIRACIIFFALFKFCLAPNTNTCSGSMHGRQLQSKHGRCAISTSHPLPIIISYHIILALCKNFLILTSPSWKKKFDWLQFVSCVCVLNVTIF